MPRRFDPENSHGYKNECYCECLACEDAGAHEAGRCKNQPEYQPLIGGMRPPLCKACLGMALRHYPTLVGKE